MESKVATDAKVEVHLPPSNVQLFEIVEPHSNDVLCGRGVTTNRHPGNKRFRSLVSLNKELYVTSSKQQKMIVSRSIVEAVRSSHPPGRFLEFNLETNRYRDIGDKKAIEKTSQALRDGATSRRKKDADVDDLDQDFLGDGLDKDKVVGNAGLDKTEGPSNYLSLKDKTKSPAKRHSKTFNKVLRRASSDITGSATIPFQRPSTDPPLTEPLSPDSSRGSIRLPPASLPTTPATPRRILSPQGRQQRGWHRAHSFGGVSSAPTSAPSGPSTARVVSFQDSLGRAQSFEQTGLPPPPPNLLTPSPDSLVAEGWNAHNMRRRSISVFPVSRGMASPGCFGNVANSVTGLNNSPHRTSISISQMMQSNPPLSNLQGQPWNLFSQFGLNGVPVPPLLHSNVVYGSGSSLNFLQQGHYGPFSNHPPPNMHPAPATRADFVPPPSPARKKNVSRPPRANDLQKENTTQSSEWIVSRSDSFQPEMSVVSQEESSWLVSHRSGNHPSSAVSHRESPSEVSRKESSSVVTQSTTKNEDDGALDADDAVLGKDENNAGYLDIDPMHEHSLPHFHVMSPLPFDGDDLSIMDLSEEPLSFPIAPGYTGG